MEITLKHLKKRYGKTVVFQDLSCSIGPGVTAVMAPSGGGKTTLLRVLLGLERPDGGTVTGLEGVRWGAVFQEDRLLEHLDARGNLRFALGLNYAEELAAKLLEALGLGDVGGKPVGAFSGGMKRRLALARALLAPWEALALDEPFAGLDDENRQRAIHCIRQAAGRGPVVLVTHDRADAEALGAKVIAL